MEDVLNRTIGEIVASDYRTAQVFKDHKIDFCCRGNRSIEEVSLEKKIELKQLMSEIQEVQQAKVSESPDFKTWPLDLLVDYIEKKHHRYVEEKIPILKQYLHRLCQVHGDSHPELFEINEEFSQSAGELAAHMKKEELILFPHVRKMTKIKAAKAELEPPHFGTVQNPVEMMMAEHTMEGDRFARISELSNSYSPPSDACNTYRVAYALLNEFEGDLHRHIHLENNILFPGSIDLEMELMAGGVE